MPEVKFRLGSMVDLAGVIDLYKKVAATEGGIARTSSEITEDYIKHWMECSIERGIWVVAESDGQIVASLHAYTPRPLVFSHIVSDLTLAITPGFQGQGLGKRLFTYFFECLKDGCPHVTRVELMVRESNIRAQKLYLSLGFKVEGRLEARVRSVGGGFEADLIMAWFSL